MANEYREKIKDRIKPKTFVLCKKGEFQGEEECVTIPRSLVKDMKDENTITRQDLWDFIQEHKDKTKNEFGGWLTREEVDRADKMIMAVDMWNDSINIKKIIKETETGDIVSPTYYYGYE